MHQLSLIILAKLKWCTLQVSDDDDASGLQNVSFAALQISAISPDQDFGQQHLLYKNTRLEKHVTHVCQNPMLTGASSFLRNKYYQSVFYDLNAPRNSADRV